jgi:hypothetical protein
LRLIFGAVFQKLSYVELRYHQMVRAGKIVPGLMTICCNLF